MLPLKEFARDQSATHLILAEGRPVYSNMNVEATPTNLVIDRDGKLVEQIPLGADPVARAEKHASS
jgi:hypothetical protein